MEKSRKSLEEKGWMFQFVADGPLADDAEKVYNLLGFEVFDSLWGSLGSRRLSTFLMKNLQVFAKWSTSGPRNKRKMRRWT
jgi:hypothetical protein